MIKVNLMKTVKNLKINKAALKTHIGKIKGFLCTPKAASFAAISIIMVFSLVRSPLAYVKPPVTNYIQSGYGSFLDKNMKPITVSTKIKDDETTDTDKYYYFSDFTEDTTESCANLFDFYTLEDNCLTKDIYEVIQGENPTPCDKGASVKTTLDRELQNSLYDLLKEKTLRSSAVVIGKKGDIQACVSTPSFDANVARSNEYVQVQARYTGTENQALFTPFHVDLPSFYHNDIDIKDVGVIEARKTFDNLYGMSDFNSEETISITENGLEFDKQKNEAIGTISPLYAAVFINAAATGNVVSPYLYDAKVDTATKEIISEYSVPAPSKLPDNVDVEKLKESFKSELLPERTIFGSSIAYENEYGSGVMVYSYFENKAFVLTVETDGTLITSEKDVLKLFEELANLI